MTDLERMDYYKTHMKQRFIFFLPALLFLGVFIITPLADAAVKTWDGDDAVFEFRDVVYDRHKDAGGGNIRHGSFWSGHKYPLVEFQRGDGYHRLNFQ